MIFREHSGQKTDLEVFSPVVESAQVATITHKYINKSIDIINKRYRAEYI